jgi:hypothetical protein
MVVRGSEDELRPREFVPPTANATTNIHPHDPPTSIRTVRPPATPRSVPPRSSSSQTHALERKGPDGKSFSNAAEAAAAAAVVGALVAHGGHHPRCVAVLCFYNAQVRHATRGARRRICARCACGNAAARTRSPNED